MRIYVWYGIDLFGLKKPVISIKRVLPEVFMH
jgi:hypothetical protein